MYKSLAKTLFVGKKIHYLPSCHSTNDLASELVTQHNYTDGDIVITSNQTAGKGQRGNTWESLPKLNLTFSIILKPRFMTANEQFNLNMAVSLGLVSYLNSLKSGFMIKWPNDIYYGEKKVCGILIQNTLRGKQIETSIIGIGLNVNQTSFNYPKAISIQTILKKNMPLKEILEGICSSFEAFYLQLKSNRISHLREQYLTQLFGRNEVRRFESDHTFEGRIIDVSKTGKLRIKENETIHEFDLKEVQFL